MRYVRQKMVQLVIVVIAVTFLTFIAINLLPGDPAIFKAGPGATDAQVEEVRKDLGLDKPIPVQYGIWLKKMVTLDFGISLGFNTPVSELVQNRLPVTLVVLLYAQIMALAVAVPLGVFTAYRAGTAFDRVSNTAAFGLLSVPNYILGVVLLYFMAVKLGLVPGHLEGRQSLRQPRRALPRLLPARVHARARTDRRLHAAAAHRHARHPSDGLHHDGTRPRACQRSASCSATRCARRSFSLDHGRGRQRRRADRRRGHRRADLRPQRHGSAHGRGDRPPGLPRRAGRA